MFLLSAAVSSKAVADASSTLLTNAQQVLDLGLDAVRRSSYPARLRGVVTFPLEGLARAYIQDATAGIQVAYTNREVRLLAGQLVEVNGVAGEALAAPMLGDAGVRVLGTAPMPEPRRLPAARFAAGDAFGQWIVLEGVVRDVAWNTDRRIFTNLLSNAVKYSPSGSPVDFTIERAGTEAVFTVRDRGVGIPSADAARLFTAFHRCSNVGEVPGTGLDLLIVKRCVELHGGSISFDSHEGAGTKFTVRLPLFETI